jgi:hypothetical protein
MGSIPIARSKIVDDSIALTPWKPLKNAFGMAGFVSKDVPKRAELFQDRTSAPVISTLLHLVRFWHH